MISGFSDVSLRPQTNIIYLWRPQDTSNNQRKYQNIFEEYIFGDLNVLEISIVDLLGKRRAPTNYKDPSKKS